LNLLIKGTATPSLEQFITQSLKEQGIKNLDKVFNAVCSELQQFCNDHLKKASEVLIFRLGELKGLALWQERFESIGLDENGVENVLQLAIVFILKTEQFLRAISQLKSLFSAFFYWLQKSVKLLNKENIPKGQAPVDTQKVTDFIWNHFNLDQISSSFLPQPIAGTLETEQSLTALYHQLYQLSHSTFLMPTKFVGQSFTATSIPVNLCTFEHALLNDVDTNIKTIQNFAVFFYQQTHYLAFWTTVNDNHFLWIFKHQVLSEMSGIQNWTFAVLNVETTVLDIAFYNQIYLTVLRKQGEVNLLELISLEEIRYNNVAFPTTQEHNLIVLLLAEKLDIQKPNIFKSRPVSRNAQSIAVNGRRGLGAVIGNYGKRITL